MNVHPLTLLTLAYLPQWRPQDLEALQERINKEAKALLAKAEVVRPRKARSR